MEAFMNTVMGDKWKLFLKLDIQVFILCSSSLLAQNVGSFFHRTTTCDIRKLSSFKNVMGLLTLLHIGTIHPLFWDFQLQINTSSFQPLDQWVQSLPREVEVVMPWCSPPSSSAKIKMCIPSQRWQEQLFSDLYRLSLLELTDERNHIDYLR